MSPTTRPPSSHSWRLGAGPLHTALALIAASGVSSGLVEIVLMASDPKAELPWQAYLMPGVAWAYLATGLAAWLRRPTNRIGAILVVGAFVWSAAVLVNVPVPALFVVGVAVATVPFAVVVHLLHAFPSGRLRGRLSTATVVAGYLVSAVLQAPIYLFGRGSPGPDTPLALADRPDLVELGQTLQQGLGAIVMLVTAVVLARRLRTATPWHRRVLGPLYVYGIVAVLFAPAVAHLPGLIDPIATFVAQLALLTGVPIAIVAAMLRGGFARTGEIEELGAWLGSDETGRPSLQAALSEALGDPSVGLAFWIEDAGGYADVDGKPVALPGPGADRAAVEVTAGGRPIGAIVYDATLIADPEIVRAAGRVVAVALDRERLTADLRVSREHLRDSRARLVEAADAERRRIARDLHDGLQTRLVLLAMKANRVRADATGPNGVQADAADLSTGIQTAIGELRELVHGVMPAALSERGLGAAAEELADSLPIPVSVDVETNGSRLPGAVESAAYFVVAEAFANAIKHAHARELRLHIARNDGWLRVEVVDDGIGGAPFAAVGPGSGSGLRGMADRVEALDGRLDVGSPASGGTRVLAEIPCGS